MKNPAKIILALALALSLSVPALAYTEGDEPQTNVYLAYDAPEPKYVVTIPAEIYLKIDEKVDLSIEVEGTETLNGGVIVISIADALTGLPSFLGVGQGADDYLIITNPKAPKPYYENLCYGITSDIAEGFLLSDVVKSPVLIFKEDGKKAVSFGVQKTVNGIDLDTGRIYSHDSYAGFVVFGIWMNPQPEPPGIGQ